VGVVSSGTFVYKNIYFKYKTYLFLLEELIKYAIAGNLAYAAQMIPIDHHLRTMEPVFHLVIPLDLYSGK
jgi:hypothetical protein